MAPAFEKICERIQLTHGAGPLKEMQDHSRNIALDDHVMLVRLAKTGANGQLKRIAAYYNRRISGHYFERKS